MTNVNALQETNFQDRGSAAQFSGIQIRNTFIINLLY